MRTRFALFIPAVAVASALTACGGGGPSNADFTAKADSACAAGNTAISTATKPGNAAQVATAAGTAVTTVDGQVATLRSMKAPGGEDKAEVGGFITALADVSAPAKALQDARAGTTTRPWPRRPPRCRPRSTLPRARPRDTA